MNANMRNARLREVCEGLGFTNVRTVISSGNVLFESSHSAAELEKMLEAAWLEKLGFVSTTIVRSYEDLQKLVAANPFKGLEHTKETSLNVTFLQSKPHEPVPAIEAPDLKTLAIYDREFCFVVNVSAEKTPNAMAKIEKLYGKKVSTRTWKTVGRIVQAMNTA